MFKSLRFALEIITVHFDVCVFRDDSTIDQDGTRGCLENARVCAQSCISDYYIF